MQANRRNEPCPCGSGKKYKKCCESSQKERGPWGTRLMAWGLAGLGVVALVLVIDTLGKGGSGGSGATEPYAYDAVNDRHWDPDHNHWHDGPPPDGVGEVDASAPTPEAWTYDQRRNRHWDPGHGHWHDGPPPIDKIGAPAQESIP